MKTEHYPSLELCKKLTEIGFPETEKDIELSVGENPMFLVMPSVMEMLDVIPPFIKNNRSYYLRITKCDDSSGYIVLYEDYELFSDTLPNALVEMILWLNKNKYITF